jgi:Rrf2 family protein
MDLSRTASYALEAVVYMAQQQLDKVVASHHIAAARRIPERFLLKVLKPLVSARVLLNVKGPNGGYRLAKPADKISILEIIEAVDGPIRGQVPLSEQDSPLQRKLEAICKEAAEAVRKQLKTVHASDLSMVGSLSEGKAGQRRRTGGTGTMREITGGLLTGKDQKVAKAKTSVRVVNAWIVSELHLPQADVPFIVGADIGVQRTDALQQWKWIEPDWGGLEQVELLVGLTAPGARVQPRWHKAVLPRIGALPACLFKVTAGKGRLTLMLEFYLARERTLLEEFTFSVDVSPAEGAP